MTDLEKEATQDLLNQPVPWGFSCHGCGACGGMSCCNTGSS